jgi:hypothetical protein
MGCSCNKGVKTSSGSQPRRNQKPVTHVVHKSPGAKKTIRRVLERY